MKIRSVRLLSVVAVLAVFCEQRPEKLSAQLPTPLEGRLVAYGGGNSLSGALGVTAAVVSPPVPLRAPADPFSDVVDASASGHTLIARRDGSVWSMGANDRGQLGLGYAGDPVESLTQIPGLVDVVKVVASGASSYAIDAGGALWVWGDDRFGQLGLGQAAMEQLTPAMNSLPMVADLDAGADFAVAADSHGAIWSWGANAASQLGAAGPDRSLPGRVNAPQGFFAVDVAAGAATALARSSTGDVMGWGSNGWHQLADAEDTINAGSTIVATGVISMAASDGHIVVAHADGSVQTRGANWAGQLGIGTQMPATGLQTVIGLGGVVDVAAGAAHSVAVTSHGLAFGWGFNHMRQLLLPTPDVFTATPQRVLDLPPTARFVRAKAASTILLSDPGAVAISTAAPAAVGCTQPFETTFAIRGFDASGGEPDQYFPGIQNLVMTFNVAPTFEIAAPVTADRGTVTTAGRTITWTIESFDAGGASVRISLRAGGAAGDFPLFSSISYRSSFDAAPTEVRSPVASHPACVVPDTTPPVISSVTPSPATLSPPNHQMMPVAIAVSATDETSVASCVVAGITSSEPPSPGESDWVITGPLTVQLRSERDPHRDGRVYAIRISCSDQAGNTATGSTTVLVPKKKKK